MLNSPFEDAWLLGIFGTENGELDRGGLRDGASRVVRAEQSDGERTRRYTTTLYGAGTETGIPAPHASATKVLTFYAEHAYTDFHVSLRGPPPYQRSRPHYGPGAYVCGRTYRVTRRLRRERPLPRTVREGPFCVRCVAPHGKLGIRSRQARSSGSHLTPFAGASHVHVPIRSPVGSAEPDLHDPLALVQCIRGRAARACASAAVCPG